MATEASSSCRTQLAAAVTTLWTIVCLHDIGHTQAFSSRHQPRLAFVAKHRQCQSHDPMSRSPSIIHPEGLCMVLAPYGSGYARPEDETSELPDSYDPMMEFPGTMRPGRTPENMPFHDLPIGDDDPDPIPWPHLQQIEWHHKWEPPHPHPIPIEEFIEMQGRWATPEMEAEIRAGGRRASRKQRELYDSQKRDMLIMDDDDEDDDPNLEFPQDLGEGLFGALGSTEDQKITAAATSPDAFEVDAEAEDEDYDVDPGLDDFLLDLGLDSLDDDEGDVYEDDDELVDDVRPAMKKTRQPPPPPEPRASGLTQGLEDVTVTDDDDDDTTAEDESASPDVTAAIDVEEDDDLELGLGEDDDLEDSVEVPLEDLGDGDNLDLEDFFDDGGFDYDDGDDFGGGDFDGF